MSTLLILFPLFLLLLIQSLLLVSFRGWYPVFDLQKSLIKSYYVFPENIIVEKMESDLGSSNYSMLVGTQTLKVRTFTLTRLLVIRFSSLSPIIIRTRDSLTSQDLMVTFLLPYPAMTHYEDSRHSTFN